MLEAKISSFDVSNLLELIKNYKGYDYLQCSKEWTLESSFETREFSKLYIFIFTQFMWRIRGIVTINVWLEFKTKSEVKLTIIALGGKNKGIDHDLGAEKSCENKIFQAINKDSNNDWIIKDINQT